MRRSHSREFSKSIKLECTDPGNDHPPQDPIRNNVPNGYDVNHLGSETYDYPENYETYYKTRNDCLGKIILDLAHQKFYNLFLAKKCNLNGMNSNIHDICDNFDSFVRLGEQQRKDHSFIIQREMEIDKKKLSSH